MTTLQRIYKEIERRLVHNHFDITIKIKRTGKEFSISQSHKRVLIMTDKGFNENGEEIWRTEIGWFKDSYEAAKFIETQI